MKGKERHRKGEEEDNDGDDDDVDNVFTELILTGSCGWIQREIIERKKRKRGVFDHEKLGVWEKGALWFGHGHIQIVRITDEEEEDEV